MCPMVLNLIYLVRSLLFQWVVTNLRQTGPPNALSPGFSWAFDLNGISEMYQSYEETNLWYLLDYGLELFLDLVLFTKITKFIKYKSGVCRGGCRIYTQWGSTEKK